MDLKNDWNPYAEKYNNMQDQSQYPILFFGFVDSFQKVSFEKYFEADNDQNWKNVIFFVFAL